MNSSNNLSRTLLLQRISDGNFHSGEALGEELGMTRAAISKHIKVLAELGLDIFRVTGKGYRLSKPLSLLDHKQITGLLNNKLDTHVTVLNIIDSTNQYLKELNYTPNNGYTCLAEAQTAGRGRHGRRWSSPYGASIYLSMFWSFATGYQGISGLSLVVGIAVGNAIKAYCDKDVTLKWPNDVYIDGKKLAGILVETEGQLGGNCHCIIGVGVNLDLPDAKVDIDQAWTDLSREINMSVDRNAFAAALVNELQIVMTQFERDGLSPFMSSWHAYDHFLDQSVRLIMGDNIVEGICRGINKEGALLLEKDDETAPYYGGEISVRAV